MALRAYALDSYEPDEAAEPLRGLELREWWTSQFRAFVPIEVAGPYCIRAAWRSSRMVAGWKGLVSQDGDEPLKETTLHRVANWYDPDHYQALRQPRSIDISRLDLELGALLPKDGLPERVRQAAQNLHMAAMTYLELPWKTSYGRVAMMHLFGPEWQRAWPSPQEILDFEQVMIVSTAGALADHPARKVRDDLREEFGLNDTELRGLVKMSLAWMNHWLRDDVEERRALMVMRLEAFQERAKAALDLRSELGAMKIQALIEGLTATNPENAMDDFVKVVAHVAKSSPRIPELEAETGGTLAQQIEEENP